MSAIRGIIANYPGGACSPLAASGLTSRAKTVSYGNALPSIRIQR